MKSAKVLLILTIIIVVGFAFNFYIQNLPGITPVIKHPPDDIAKILNTTGMPLKLREGITISIFAKDLPGARVLLFDTLGNLWVSQTREGIISLITIENGKVMNSNPVFKNLKNPHGLALDPDDPFMLYIAEEDKISRFKIYSEGKFKKIADLPCCGGHFTRTIGFGPDKRLYVSIGSSCNVCDEKNPQRATIISMKKDGTDIKEFARGLRNSVFFTWHPETNKMWATDMGRDLIGDDIPPDEINIVLEGKDYGWPLCYGKNILDTNFHNDDHTHIINDCDDSIKMKSHIDIQAHSAPLGLSFIKNGWPTEFQDNLLVAFHGSWNRTVPTGYKIVRYNLPKCKAENLPPEKCVEAFIDGWLTNDGALGRPVDIISHKNNVFVSDDKAGVIYKIDYKKNG